MAKEHVMEAVFSEESFNALMDGRAVDKNGFRSCKGNYWPDQPTYRLKKNYNEDLKEAGVKLAILASGYVVFEIVLPCCKKMVDEKVYPCIAEKFDEWKNKKKEKKGKQENHSEKQRKLNVPENEDKVIALSQYRKQA